MSNLVTVTEWIRFNDDGSSDHIKVVGDQVLESCHYTRSPWFRSDKNIAWAVHIHPQAAVAKPET